MYAYPTTNNGSRSKIQRQNFAVTCASISFFSALTLAVIGLLQTVQTEDETPIISAGDIDPQLLGGSMLAGSALFFVIGCCVIRSNRNPEKNPTNPQTALLNRHSRFTITNDPEHAKKQIATPRTLTQALLIAEGNQNRKTDNSLRDLSNSV